MSSAARVPPQASVQLVYRDVNERIHSIGAELFELRGDQEIEIVCECSSTTCCERIQLAAGVYEQLRDQPRRFALIPGHERLEIEQVVELHPGYVIVEKEATGLDLSGYPTPQGVSS